jgi:hypothetical protein
MTALEKLAWAGLAIPEDSDPGREHRRTDMQVLTWCCRSEWFGILDTDTDYITVQYVLLMSGLDSHWKSLT